ncbi:hypothetical protein ISN45_At05g050220 [Arabidopsis thaliana x Arabidopsis arenosa]|uniref:Uncharacterized protein n=1 Tax=Arabidopsis thaliana x Arabidopsis arenosa TaxID=1240361 RepID=A0A8T2D0M4_9BRAS|nr:hypothetical protein ISN45_At05g050220 [Arabidopsis thaliana x Arabidopsis arenosa]
MSEKIGRLQFFSLKSSVALNTLNQSFSHAEKRTNMFLGYRLSSIVTEPSNSSCS